MTGFGMGDSVAGASVNIVGEYVVGEDVSSVGE